MSGHWKGEGIPPVSKTTGRWAMAGGQQQRWASKARCFVSLNTSGVGQDTTQDFVIICSLEEVFSWDSLPFGSELNHVRKVFLIVPIIIKEWGLASFLVLHGDNLALAWLLSRSDWNDLKAEVMAGLLANIPFSSTCCSVFSRHPRVFWLFSGKKKEEEEKKEEAPAKLGNAHASCWKAGYLLLFLAWEHFQGYEPGFGCVLMCPWHHKDSCFTRGDRSPQPHISTDLERWFNGLWWLGNQPDRCPQHSRSKTILHVLRKACISTKVKTKDAKVHASPISSWAASMGTVALISEVGNNSL